MSDTLTGLLREMACSCPDFTEPGILSYPAGNKCARCRALALAEEQERQLAAAQAALRRIHKGACLTAQDSKSRDDDRYCIADVINTASAALFDNAAALDAHDERVWREALESASIEADRQADALFRSTAPGCYNAPAKDQGRAWRAAASMLRVRAKRGRNENG